jgi:hypothetical protein
MGTEFGVEKRKDGSMRLSAHAEFSHYCEHENYYLIPAIDSVESLVTAPLKGLEDLASWNVEGAGKVVDEEEK